MRNFSFLWFSCRNCWSVHSIRSTLARE